MVKKNKSLKRDCFVNEETRFERNYWHVYKGQGYTWGRYGQKGIGYFNAI